MTKALRDLPAKRFIEVADGVVAVVHGDGTMGVANCALIANGEGAFAFDALTLPEMAAGVIDEMARRGLRVTTVLNSHHHVDHVGGNAAFGDANVVAHPVSASIVTRMAGNLDQVARLMPRFAAELERLDLRSPHPASPALSVPRGGELLTFTPAHTPADVALWLPRDRVLLAGDVCFNGVAPLAVHGVVSAWLAALDRLMALDPAVVVPGHGPLATVVDLKILHDYLASLWDTAQRAHRDGVPEAEALAGLDTGAVGEWLEPGRTAINFRRALLEARGELGDGL